MWLENWIPRKEMMRPFGCKVQNPMRFATDFIDSTSAKWDRHRVEQTFLPIDVPAIMAIPMCTRNIEDYWAWSFERNDSFFVRSAYIMLVATIKHR